MILHPGNASLRPHLCTAEPQRLQMLVPDKLLQSCVRDWRACELKPMTSACNFFNPANLRSQPTLEPGPSWLPAEYSL